MSAAEWQRESTTQARRSTGFRADLPGLDLATLLQLVCVSPERRVLQVVAGGLTGFLFVQNGRMVHALLEGEAGETALGLHAALLILAFRDGEVCLCDRAFPPRTSMDLSVEELLLRAAQASDEADTRTRGASHLNSVLPLRPGATASPAQHPASPARHPASPAQHPAGQAQHPAGQALADSGASGPVARADAKPADAPLASVRLDANGRIVTSQGNAQLLAQLVAYVTRMSAIVAHHLALEPFEMLEAELGQLRLLVFVDGADMVGMLVPQGALFNELRNQLSA